MKVAILNSQPSLSLYLGEILKTWGLALFEYVEERALAGLTPEDWPVVLCPAAARSANLEEQLVAYAERGGHVICCLPSGELARAAGLERVGEKEGPLRLRVTGFPAAGLTGELLPVVGRAATYQHADDVDVLAFLSHPGRYEGESVGIARASVGRGNITAFAFDLARCVFMLRQGDPARADFVPEGDGCARPSHMACDIGPNDSGWVPYADLLSRLLVDLVREAWPGPAPMLWHLPGQAQGMLLYSGDEDGAQVAWNEEEFAYLTNAGARMNLYIIPTGTKSTKADVDRYRESHDIGPHPNLRPLDGHPLDERLAELERQFRLFEELFGFSPRTTRHHSTVWPGYTEPAEIMERMGIRMEGNFFSGTYRRDRLSAPYAGFGAAMPMRFCRPDGQLIDVFQQHTHVPDDAMFHPTVDYSLKISAEAYAIMLERIFSDVATRFHTPYAVCIHPGNWVRFSAPQGRELLRQAAEREMPVWSFDQWSEFWDARDSWRLGPVAWSGTELSFTAEGASWNENLRLLLPAECQGRPLTEVSINGETAESCRTARYREPVALVPVPEGCVEVTVGARYG